MGAGVGVGLPNDEVAKGSKRAEHQQLDPPVALAKEPLKNPLDSDFDYRAHATWVFVALRWIFPITVPQTAQLPFGADMI